jgi:hypothetical protein
MSGAIAVTIDDAKYVRKLILSAASSGREIIAMDQVAPLRQKVSKTLSER